MKDRRRRLAAVFVFAAALIAVPLVLAQISASKPKADPAAAQAPHTSRLEAERGEEAGGADAEAYADRAYPDSEVSADEVQRAVKADAKLKTKLPKLGSKWESLGPDMLDVDRLGTQSFV